MTPRGGPLLQSMRSPKEQPFWLVPADETMRVLASRSEGLTSRDAANRLARDGANVIDARIRQSLAARTARRVAEPLTAILLISAAVSGATGDCQSFIIISLIVALSIALDVFQEHKAETAIAALQRSIAVTARICRDGMPVELPVKDIVKGDVIELRGGDLVPADGIVLSSRGAVANEAILTGEPYPVEKSHEIARSSSIAEASNALFAGTTIVGGEAKMLVVRTGKMTSFGAIAASVQAKEPPTSFERGLHRLGLLILRLTAFLVLFVLLTQLVKHGLSLEIKRRVVDADPAIA